MNGLKIVHKLGLVVFIIGFGLFLSIYFMGDYQLKKQHLASALGEENAAAYAEYFQPLFSASYTSQYSFLAAVGIAFQGANEAILSDYTVKDEVANKVASLAENNTYTTEFVDRYYSDKTFEGAVWQKEQLKSYSSWMNERKYDSPEALEQELANVIQNVNNSIIESKGYSDNTIKNQRFTLIMLADRGGVASNPWLWLFLAIGLPIIGAALYLLPRIKLEKPGIKNDNTFHQALKSRGWLGMLTGGFLISFYIFLYFFPAHLSNWIQMVDPVSKLLSGNPASQWFLYGFLYTIAILVMGVRMMLKYRHSAYQIARTGSVMFFQLTFAFLIPEILVRLNQPYMDLKNMWPLDYSFFFDYRLDELMANGSLGIFMLGWGIALFLIGVPLFTYLYGKRWYCSWVCGCGGLAETLGDPYRQLSDKSVKAWKFERISIHTVLVLAVVMTAAVLYTYFSGASYVVGINTYDIRSAYGFGIGAIFSGVIGTGFYPLMGNRVWCRFGCPLAAYLGIVQRFKSRFRITTNGGQCISCGNCSTYCEMGIDVRWYAQRGQSIVRSSCVGCGVCSSVCPRGVLNLENKDTTGRLNQPILIGNDSFELRS
ncbi:MAG: ferredoxin-type protein NapH [Marivirga sp.]|jgi:ferredoxin-type protein NapH